MKYSKAYPYLKALLDAMIEAAPNWAKAPGKFVSSLSEQLKSQGEQENKQLEKEIESISKDELLELIKEAGSEQKADIKFIVENIELIVVNIKAVPEILRTMNYRFDKVDEKLEQIKNILQREQSISAIAAKYEDFNIVDGAFWDKVRDYSDKKHLYLYYTNTDSSPVRLLDVVANDYYVVNEKTDSMLALQLERATKNSTVLVKILSRAGEGKSTFLWHIAKKYSGRFNVVILEDITKEVLIRVERALVERDLDLPVVMLLDNPSICGEELVRLGPKIVAGFRKRGLVFAISEREFRYSNIEDIDVFENNFDYVAGITYQAGYLRGQIFDKLFKLLEGKYEVPGELKQTAREIYLSDRRKSTSECTFAVVKYLRSVGKIRFAFDWEDWEKFASSREPRLKDLYLVLATFYQFGFNLAIDFCAGFLEGVKNRDIIRALGDSYNLPIYRRGGRLFLRHETIASWYLDDAEEATRKNRDCSEDIFREFLGKIEGSFERDLLIWIYKNKDFQDSYLAKYLSIERRAELLRGYIEAHQKELKCRTELAKIYQHEGKYKGAEEILLECIGISPKDLNSRTELAKIYQHEGKYKEAEEILLECIGISPKDLNSRTELAKIYQHEGKYKEAEEILIELLGLDEDNLQARTELAKIYQHEGKYKEAEEILLECIGISPKDLNSRTELAKIYQHEGKYKEAEEILRESLKIDNKQLHPRTELAKVYQHEGKYKEAEEILLESLKIDNKQLHPRTELAKIYQHEGKYKEAERYLKEYLEIDVNGLHPRTELAKIYQHQDKYEEAEEILRESLKIDNKQLHPRTELAKIYQHEGKYKEAEEILRESLKIDNKQLHPRTELAKVYQHEDKYKEAEEILHELLGLDERDLQAHTEMAKVYQHEGKYKEAEEILHELLGLDEKNLQARTELAKVYQHKGKYKEAEEILHELLGLDEDDLQARTELAKIYQHEGKYKEAEEILLELLEIDEHNFFAMAELIRVYDKMGKVEECFVKFDGFLGKGKIRGERKPQAMFNNIFKLCSRLGWADKAKAYFKEYSHILDQRNTALYKRLFEDKSDG